MRAEVYLLDKNLVERTITEEVALEKMEEIGFFSTEEKELLFMDAVESNYLEVASKFGEIFENKKTILNSVFVTGSKYGMKTLEFLLELAKKYNFDVDYTYSCNSESVITCFLRDERFEYLDKIALKNWLENIKKTFLEYVLSDFEVEAFWEVVKNYEDLETFKLLFEMLPNEQEKRCFLRTAVQSSKVFEDCDVLEFFETFGQYIIAKNVSKKDIENLRELRISEANILRAMMFITSEENYLYSYEYFRDELEVFTWDAEKKFKLVISNWYDWIL